MYLRRIFMFHVAVLITWGRCRRLRGRRRSRGRGRSRGRSWGWSRGRSRGRSRVLRRGHWACRVDGEHDGRTTTVSARQLSSTTHTRVGDPAVRKTGVAWELLRKPRDTGTVPWKGESSSSKSRWDKLAKLKSGKTAELLVKFINTTYILLVTSSNFPKPPKTIQNAIFTSLQTHWQQTLFRVRISRTKY